MAGFLPTLYLQSLLSIPKAKVVILDWVVSQAENFGDIGFAADDHRGNVAYLRMREVLINILPVGIASGNIAITPSERLNSFGEVITSRIPYVCHFAQWTSGRRIRVRVDQASTSDDEKYYAGSEAEYDNNS